MAAAQALRVAAVIVVAAAGLLGGRLIRSSVEEPGSIPETPEAIPGQRGRPPAEWFDMTNLAVPRVDIRDGGVLKDEIPAIDDPQPRPLADVEHIPGDERAIVVTRDGVSRAYPLRVMRWHEAVNDELGGEKFTVVYCPLCDSVSLLDRTGGPGTPDDPTSFGISGRLWMSNVLLYDRGGDALWSQSRGTAMTGPQVGARLAHLANWSVETMDVVRARPEPVTVVLPSPRERPYHRDPFEGYTESDTLRFPVEPVDRRLPLKSMIIGVAAPSGEATAWPLESIARSSGTNADTRLELEAPGGTLVLHVVTGDADGAGPPAIVRFSVLEAPADAAVMHTMWFAWFAAHPDTSIESLD